jgi:putative sterol carrier protein
MTATAREIFERAADVRQQQPYLRGVRGTYLFEIENVGAWFVTVDDGTVKIERTRRAADCTIRCNEEDFVSIVEGKRNLLTAGLQGRVLVSGDIALAQKFHGFVRMIAERQDASERGAS